MRNLIRITVLLALLGGRTTIAQTVGSAGSRIQQAPRSIAQP
jgi:hypothetical protein